MKRKERVQYYVPVRARKPQPVTPPMTMCRWLIERMTPFKDIVLDVYSKCLSPDQFSLMCAVVMDAVDRAVERRHELAELEDWSEDDRVLELKRFLFPIEHEIQLDMKRVCDHGPMQRREYPARFWSRPRRRYFAIEPDYD